jgi:hypothetical protein
MNRFGERLFLFSMPVVWVVMCLFLISSGTPIAVVMFAIQDAVFGSERVAIRAILSRLVPSPRRIVSPLPLPAPATLNALLSTFCTHAPPAWNRT